MNTVTTDSSTEIEQKPSEELYNGDRDSETNVPFYCDSATEENSGFGQSDLSISTHDEMPKFYICSCGCKDVPSETNDELLLRRLDEKIKNMSEKSESEPSVSLLIQVVETLSDAFEQDSQSAGHSSYVLKSWAGSIEMEGILHSLAKILRNLEPMKYFGVYDCSMDSKLDTLVVFVVEIIKMQNIILNSDDWYTDYEIDPDDMQEDLMSCISAVRKNNNRIGILTGKYPLTGLPKFAKIESVLDFLPKDDSPEECAVCKSVKLLPETNFGVLSNCSHVFCAPCLGRAFESSSRCPLCRVESEFWLSRDTFLQLKSGTSPPPPPPPATDEN